MARMLKTDITVCIPWRATSDRTPAYHRVNQHWCDMGFNLRVASDSLGRQPFNLSQARNRAVLKAKTEFVLLADADTVLERSAIEHAMDVIDPQHDVVWLFNEYRLLPANAAYVKTLDTVHPLQVYHGSWSPNILLRRELYWQLGGFDERFKGWGYEDSAFRIVAGGLADAYRVSGVAYAFDHDGHRDMSKVNPNRNRYRLYQHCAGDPELLRQVIR